MELQETLYTLMQVILYYAQIVLRLHEMFPKEMRAVQMTIQKQV
jgi:hypothetical protein